MVGNISDEEYLTGGHFACPGCPATLGLRLALKALNGKAIVINASGCMTLLPVYPYTPLKVPWLHIAIENAGAAATGVFRALRKKRKQNTHVLVYAGDGATYDIGLQSLSAAIERRDDFVYICYNNEAYGNTGMQKCSSTPQGAITTTTPTGKELKKKNIEEIIAAHECYVATASIGYPMDFMRKVKYAADIKGPSFINLLCPCPTGWGFDNSKTIEMGKLAVDVGYWELYEIIDGIKRINIPPTRISEKDVFFSAQKRFKL